MRLRFPDHSPVTETRDQGVSTLDDTIYPVSQGPGYRCCEVAHHGRFREVVRHRYTNYEQTYTVVVTIMWSQVGTIDPTPRPSGR